MKSTAPQQIQENKISWYNTFIKIKKNKIHGATDSLKKKKDLWYIKVKKSKTYGTLKSRKTRFM